MRVLVVGAGGVGAAIVSIAARRPFFEHLVVADIDLDRARRAAAPPPIHGSRRRRWARPTSSTCCHSSATRADVVVNACDPRFNPPIFDAASAAGVTYLDMAMHLSEPHPTAPYEQVGRILGEAQLASHDAWAERGQLAIVGMGVEPGLSDVFARHAADHLFSRIDELNVRDGANLHVGGYDFAPTFSIWTTIEECLNPPIVYERDRAGCATEPFSEPEVFRVPRRDRTGRVRQRPNTKKSC
ncbi:MAG: saccharopine dehydrogenase NADP-binding domain-containing protein [Ilumatobacteraceae bacterium]